MLGMVRDRSASEGGLDGDMASVGTAGGKEPRLA